MTVQRVIISYDCYGYPNTKLHPSFYVFETSVTIDANALKALEPFLIERERVQFPNVDSVQVSKVTYLAMAPGTDV